MATSDTKTATAATQRFEKDNPDLTPYEAAKVLTVLLRRINPDASEVQPQTMYGLANRKAIKTVEKPGTKANGESKIYFDGDAFAEYAKAFVAGQATGQGRQRRDYDVLAASYDLGTTKDESDEPETTEPETTEPETTEPETTEPETTEPGVDDKTYEAATGTKPSKAAK